MISVSGKLIRTSTSCYYNMTRPSKTSVHTIVLELIWHKYLVTNILQHSFFSVTNSARYLSVFLQVFFSMSASMCTTVEQQFGSNDLDISTNESDQKPKFGCLSYVFGPLFCEFDNHCPSWQNFAFSVGWFDMAHFGLIWIKKKSATMSKVK